MVRFNWPILVVTAIGLFGLILIFVFDPTHNYPTKSGIVDLSPGNSTNMSVPTSSTGFLQWAGTLISDPYLWVNSEVSDLEVIEFSTVVTNVLLSIVPGVRLGVPMTYNTTTYGMVIVRNVGNESVSGTISFTVAPTPTALGNAKAWWYIVFGFLQTFIGCTLALLRQKATTECC
jgi:hypothetical protein